MKEMWDKRYSQNEYVYGTNPNEFLAEELKKLSPGKLLLLGEGEGRNAVFAALNGWDVTAVDYSEEGKKKTEELAANNNVAVNYIVADLNTFTPDKNCFDAVGIIFLHLPEELREKVHSEAVKSLKADGALILEVFEKDQLKRDSGGPKAPELLYELEDIYNDFNELDIDTFSKDEIILNEGEFHKGDAVVIRYSGKKTKEN